MATRAQQHGLHNCRFMKGILFTLIKHQPCTRLHTLKLELGEVALAKAPDKTFVKRLLSDLDDRVNSFSVRTVDMVRRELVNDCDRLLRINSLGLIIATISYIGNRNSQGPNFVGIAEDNSASHLIKNAIYLPYQRLSGDTLMQGARNV